MDQFHASFKGGQEERAELLKYYARFRGDMGKVRGGAGGRQRGGRGPGRAGAGAAMLPSGDAWLVATGRVRPHPFPSVPTQPNPTTTPTRRPARCLSG